MEVSAIPELVELDPGKTNRAIISTQAEIYFVMQKLLAVVPAGSDSIAVPSTSWLTRFDVEHKMAELEKQPLPVLLVFVQNDTVGKENVPATATKTMEVLPLTSVPGVVPEVKPLQLKVSQEDIFPETVSSTLPLASSQTMGLYSALYQDLSTSPAWKTPPKSASTVPSSRPLSM